MNNRFFTEAPPFVNVDEVFDGAARGYEERGAKKRRNSLDNLLEMFPLPPSYIPPLPPLPVAIRELLDEVILKDTRRRPSFSTVNRFSSSSSCESTTSSMFSGSASCDTTQTSPPSTPNSTRSPFSPVESTFAEIDVHEDDTCGFPATPDTPSFAQSPFSPLEPTFVEIDGHSSAIQSPFSPVEPTFAEIDGHEDDIYGFPVAPKVEILLWPAESMCEGELRTLREPAEVDPFSLSVEYALALQEHAAADEDTAFVTSKHFAASDSSSAAHLGENENEDLTQYICPEFFTSSSDYDALVKFHDHNVAAYACASFANLGGKVPEEQEFDRGSEDQPVVRDMLDISPSEEAIVDSLLSQLETSFELDEKEGPVHESPLDWYAEQGFDHEVEYGCYDFPSVVSARALPSVAPLRIVKKNMPKPLQPVVLEREEDVNHAQEVHRVISGHWEENMANALKAFREAEAEDEDFRELFYRDSSCYSESSCVVKNVIHGRQYSGASSDGFYDPERLKRLDESFESLERSMEQILADLDQMYDGDVTLKLEEGAVISRSGAGVVKDLRQQEDTKDDDASSVSEYSDVNEDSGADGVVPCTWGFSDDDDERETSSGGESDQWSDILELDDCSAESSTSGFKLQ